MTAGKTGEVYNVADNEQTYSLLELAKMLSGIAGTSIKFDNPDQLEKKGASTFQDVCLDSTKLVQTGWKPMVDIEEGLKNTVSHIRNVI